MHRKIISLLWPTVRYHGGKFASCLELPWSSKPVLVSQENLDVSAKSTLWIVIYGQSVYNIDFVLVMLMRVDFLSGVIPALVTPMHADSSLDMLTWQQLLAWQDGQSCSAVVVLGSTAEALLLSISEREQLLQQVKASLHNTAWIVGVSACSSAEAIKLALQAQQAGAHAVMLSAPYYIRPCQRGLLAYVHAVAAAVDLPIILYDVPARSATAFSDATLVECAKLPKVVRDNLATW